jgi:1,4-alpha-glucan branching enzyme
MTPMVRNNWKIYANGKTSWKEIFNSDRKEYWGTGDTLNPDPVTTLVDKNQNQFEINVHLPPLGAIVLR